MLPVEDKTTITHHCIKPPILLDKEVHLGLGTFSLQSVYIAHYPITTWDAGLLCDLGNYCISIEAKSFHYSIPKDVQAINSLSLEGTVRENRRFNSIS